MSLVFFQATLTASFGTLKTAHGNSTYVVFEASFMTTATTATGAKTATFKVGAKSVDLTFTAVAAAVDVTTNSTVMGVA